MASKKMMVGLRLQREMKKAAIRLPMISHTLMMVPLAQMPRAKFQIVIWGPKKVKEKNTRTSRLMRNSSRSESQRQRSSTDTGESCLLLAWLCSYSALTFASYCSVMSQFMSLMAAIRLKPQRASEGDLWRTKSIGVSSNLRNVMSKQMKEGTKTMMRKVTSQWQMSQERKQARVTPKPNVKFLILMAVVRRAYEHTQKVIGLPIYILTKAPAMPMVIPNTAKIGDQLSRVMPAPTTLRKRTMMMSCLSVQQRLRREPRRRPMTPPKRMMVCMRETSDPSEQRQSPNLSTKEVCLSCRWAPRWSQGKAQTYSLHCWLVRVVEHVQSYWQKRKGRMKIEEEMAMDQRQEKKTNQNWQRCQSPTRAKSWWKTRWLME